MKHYECRCPLWLALKKCPAWLDGKQATCRQWSDGGPGVPMPLLWEGDNS